ncbi:NAD+ synthase [Candidatus Velamenicoccus archaeovorus]|uniref:Glutamine-dependent NAD(+) synthetase n=1 Tax=Velamenicoccus archaeovorus TaxID=1930593 RepID=A0A410P5N6_VELA1|nr:NAD+ synthase [Candidatus Velamenicoccus archaeovorus]QAT17453.1 NAD+ synthase [Candidatus Velamenicoccus archaeovorus]
MPEKTQKIRIALAQVNPVVGDLAGNAAKIAAWIQKALRAGADIVSFPELCITGYPPEDLLFKSQFIDDNLAALKAAARATGDITAIVGFVDRKKNRIYNAAAVLSRGRIVDVYHKVFLPNYGVFDEMRYFAAGDTFPVFGLGRTSFGVNICEDIWHLDGPAGIQAYRGARLIVNINASPYHMGKGEMRRRILKKQARRNGVFIAYTNLVGGQDELVFDGQSLIVDDKGRVVAQGRAFEEELLVRDIELPVVSRKPAIMIAGAGEDKPPLGPHVAVPPNTIEEEVYGALVLGLKDYVLKNGFKKIVLGLSGGIDSSLVAAMAADAIGSENVLGVLMPSAYTSQESGEDARLLAQNLNIKTAEIPIQKILEAYLAELGGVFAGKAPDITEENLQARIRGNIIMAISNKFGYLAVNTGNKSEVSCGYCTLYGDMAGGFGAIKDVPKTLVYRLAEYKNKAAGRGVIPGRVLTKAPTAELRLNQKDADTLPPYDVLDPVLKLYVEEDKGIQEIVAAGIDGKLAAGVVRMVDFNEYKRRQSAPGIKISPKAFGKDRRMPITNKYR